MHSMDEGAGTQSKPGEGTAKPDRFRRQVLLSGALGIAGCTLLVAGSTWLVCSGTLEPWFPQRWVVLILVVLLGGFSLAEIPLMVYAMRRLAMERAGNQRAVTSLNTLYVFFAGVYGAPVILLTGSTGWGVALSSLSLVRSISSWLFVLPAADQTQDGRLES
ncbi:MAG: hypothetical protein PVJ26_11985 [Anaerolineae bacterium]|jgi:hypothetical protein